MPEQIVYLMTERGKKDLGELLKLSREALGMSLDDLMIHIANATGHRLSKSAISDLENGKTDPRWNTLAIIAAAKHALDPVTGRPLSPPDMFNIACECNDRGS
jgi:transcriptional regulator with XRE-family HTH domain